MRNPNRPTESDDATPPSLGALVSWPARERVTDPVPHDVRNATTASDAADSAPRIHGGRIGTEQTGVSWRARMRWLDDGGR
jgi:hypothetical protein